MAVSDSFEDFHLVYVTRWETLRCSSNKADRTKCFQMYHIPLKLSLLNVNRHLLCPNTILASLVLIQKALMKTFCLKLTNIASIYFCKASLSVKQSAALICLAFTLCIGEGGAGLISGHLKCCLIGLLKRSVFDYLAANPTECPSRPLGLTYPIEVLLWK